MSAFGRLCDRVPLSDITKHSGQHANFENSLYQQKGRSTKLGDARCQRDNADYSRIMMGNPYIPHVMRLQEQGSSEPSELNCRYNGPTAKNKGDLKNVHSWIQAHPEGHKMIQTSLDLLMSHNRKVHPPNFSGSTYGGELTNATSSQVHATAYSSKGQKMIQMPLEMQMSQSRNVWPPNLSGSNYGVELASVTNQQVRSTAFSSGGHRMIQTPMDLLMSESRNVGLPNSTCSAVGGVPTNIPSSQVHGTAYSFSGHKMIQTPVEMLVCQSRNVCPPNLSGYTYGVELASVANPQVHSTAYSSQGHRMIQTPMDLLMYESRNVALPNYTCSAVGRELTNVPSSQVHGTSYSSSGYKMIQAPLEMLMPQSRNVCPPNLSGSSCGVELASVANPQVHSTTYSSRGQVMVQTPMDLLMSESRNVDLPNSSVSTVGGEPTNVPSLQVLGTEDDLPPPYLNSRDMRGSGNVTGDGRVIVPASSQARAQTDMEAQIHQLEQQAYCSVLRAFKAQSDTITWEKEDLITKLREELRVSDEAHRQLLNRINNDDLIHSIREWRTTGGLEESLPNNPKPIHDPVSSHTTSACKRQKTSKSATASLAPPPAMHSQRVATLTQPSSSTATKAVPLGTNGKKTKPCHKVPGGSAVKPTSSSEGPIARGPNMNQYFPGGPAAEFSQAQNVNPLIGRKAMTRWPDDDTFYEVVISDYNPETDLYAVVYDINTSNETWEWVDLKKVGPEDIRWLEDDSEIDPVMYLRSQGAPYSGARNAKSTTFGVTMPGDGRGRSFQKSVSENDFPHQKNSVRKRGSRDINILQTESLMKQVEKVCSVSNPDPLKVEEAKKALKEQEHSLVDSIARLAEESDDETDGHNRGHQKEAVNGEADSM